ncbi:MAG: ATP-binding protein [Chloroflexota bacterium]|nr:ATP-binding protein [Chloroflexota bacterium]
MVNAAAEGVPGVALLSAVAGTGKSSLLEEICREASRGHRDLVVL